jgi:transcriptional regulator GlxA family with amidase domain
MSKTVILVLQQTNTLSLAAAVDPLRAANRHAGRARFDWQFATPEARDVMLTCGLGVPAAPIHRVTGCDLLIVVAGFDLAAQATPHLMASLRRLAGRDTTVMAIDGGPWITAQAGLLNGHRATTHWEDLDNFAAAFDEVETVNARYVVSGHRWTSGGAAPALDMMLHLIQTRLGDSVARQVAAGFIHTTRPAPSDPQLRHPPAQGHSAITARAHQLMEANLEQPLPLTTIATHLGRSPRSLQLHFRRTLGITAKAHYRTLRLTEAHRLLTQSRLNLQDIALSTGFCGTSSLSHAYTLQYGMSPSKARSSLHLAQ